MPQFPTDHFIKEKVEVDDPEREATMRRGAARRPPQLNLETDNVYILGLDGSGRRELGELLAASLGCPLEDLRSEPAVAALDAAVRTPGRVVLLPPRVVEAAESCAKLQSSGKVFAMLADVPIQLDRLGLSGRERDERRAELGDQASMLEPLFMACAHQFFRADTKMKQLQRSALLFLGRES